MRILLTTIVFCIFTYNSLNAQEVLLHENVASDTITPKFGPNRLHFLHLYVDYAFFVDDGEKGAAVLHGNTAHLDIGFRYKYKISNFYAIGGDIAINSTRFHLKQNDKKILPNTKINDKERYDLTTLQLGFYNRFNFGKRGNFLGYYIDLGVHGCLHTNLRHFTENEQPNGFIVSTTTSGLDYYERWGWGLHARIAYNRWVLSGSYRLSNLFKKSAAWPELPRASVGFQIGLH